MLTDEKCPRCGNADLIVMRFRRDSQHSRATLCCKRCKHVYGRVKPITPTPSTLDPHATS